ncbi:CLIP domain-containing serine protease HP8-like [Schistocerca piceifrons]|uniref:CLIP domain-containing serine protease HP8-like n=1 Tax=Schistocerca piceifrons TaxID=274613 RepID=UPI001F5E6109|nr:CLIP domain-containing serine protease HP8-like [Schistocerca piceifrons]
MWHSRPPQNKQWRDQSSDSILDEEMLNDFYRWAKRGEQANNEESNKCFSSELGGLFTQEGNSESADDKPKQQEKESTIESEKQREIDETGSKVYHSSDDVSIFDVKSMVSKPVSEYNVFIEINNEVLELDDSCGDEVQEYDKNNEVTAENQLLHAFPDELMVNQSGDNKSENIVKELDLRDIIENKGSQFLEILWNQYNENDGPPVLLCDGALVTRRYVLTVAQCVIHKNLNRYKLVSVRLGEWDQRTDVDCDGDFCVPPAQDFGIEQSIPHPEYTPKLSNDIALLRLDRDAPYSPFITPICLPVAPEMRHATFVGKNLVVSGWGDTREVKLYIQQPVVDEQTCQQRYSRWNQHIMPSHICAGSKEGNNSCYGRSGSPLMAFEGQPPRGFLIGVVSFGPTACIKVDAPTVYTRVSSFLTWILDNIRP